MNATTIRAGFLTSVQDLGRVGYRRFGVSPGGALDPLALRLVNLLVGNDEDAAGLEIAFGGLRLLFHDQRVVSWCGAESTVQTGATKILPGYATIVGIGEELIIHPPKIGCRTWLAISGGIDVPVVLGSRATDLRAAFGGLNGRSIRDGDELPLFDNPDRAQVLIRNLRDQKVATWKPTSQWTSPARTKAIVRFVRGSEWMRFTDSSHHALTSTTFSVLADSDRMGVRLQGAKVERNDDDDLLSQAVAPGAVQVPPSGDPILLLGDCQTIGGYPKIGHVITVDLPIAAQLRPNDTVSFREVPLEEAQRLLLVRESDVAMFRCGLDPHFL